MKTRDQQEIHQLAQSIKQEVHVVALGRLAQESAGVFEIADAFLNRELQELIDDGKSNSRRNSISTD